MVQRLKLGLKIPGQCRAPLIVKNKNVHHLVSLKSKVPFSDIRSALAWAVSRACCKTCTVVFWCSLVYQHSPGAMVALMKSRYFNTFAYEPIKMFRTI